VSLATRCTACGTVFRVVQDQLRVSGGWVRCGRCSQVFNAVESLVDLELDRPAEGAAPSVHGERVMQDLARVAGVPAPSHDPSADGELKGGSASHDRLPNLRADLIESDGTPSPVSGDHARPPREPDGSARAADRDAAPDWEDEESPVERTVVLGPPTGREEAAGDGEAVGGDVGAGGSSAAAGEGSAAEAADQADETGGPVGPDGTEDLDELDDSAASDEAADVAEAPAGDAEAPADREGPADWARLATGAAAAGSARRRRAPRDDAAAPPPPSFLREAERAARWRRPWVRATLAALALVLSALLAAQMVWVQHDLVAARWPAMRPAVQALCEQTGCTIEAPRRIESLAVESSGLVRAGSAGGYRLNVLLRNREDLALMPPSLDLSLTDAQGRLIARRVVTPAELGAAGRLVPPTGELALQALLRSQDPGVVGYTIEIFYP